MAGPIAFIAGTARQLRARIEDLFYILIEFLGPAMSPQSRPNLRTVFIFFWAFCLICCFGAVQCPAVGITPEQIFQHSVDPVTLLGTWEKLPEVNPLAEKLGKGALSEFRTLMTLRKDGTCRIFDGQNPSGIDGVWIYENHHMAITLNGTIRLELFVYGVKDDFMVTRSPVKNGIDQLWSRVK